jgi:hypothetical protein
MFDNGTTTKTAAVVMLKVLKYDGFRAVDVSVMMGRTVGCSKTSREKKLVVQYSTRTVPEKKLKE